MGDPVPGMELSRRLPGDRLDSWKEVAVYLNRDVTTVQRWEKREGMPVHRHVHDRVGSVYAYREELDAWVRSRKVPEPDRQVAEPPNHAAVSPPSSSQAEMLANPARKTRIAVVAAGLASLLLLGGYFIRRSAQSASASGGRLIIGVLPLKNLSGDAGQEYFVDGLTEEVVTQLGQLNPERIGVVRCSPQPGEQQEVSAIPELARQSGARYVLEGSVRRQDAHARISLQLIRVPDQAIIWTESFDRSVGDVLSLQSEIAQRIGSELEVQVLGHPAPRPVNPEVVEAYLRGRFELSRHDSSDSPLSDAARINFERAAALDRSYAPAYAGLADFYRLKGGEKDEDSEQAWPLAAKYADQALSLDPRGADAHVALAWIKLAHDWDWEAARNHVLRALELNPSSPEAHSVYATYLRIAGDVAEAVNQRKQALALDPSRSDLRERLASEYFFARDYPDAVALARQALSENPLDASQHYGLCNGLRYMKRFDESVAECGKVLALEGHMDWVDAYLQQYRSHGYEAARLLIEGKRLRLMERNPHADLWDLANAYVAVGKIGETLSILEKGIPIHDSGLLQLRVDPDFDPIRGDPRYAALLRQINFPNN